MELIKHRVREHPEKKVWEHSFQFQQWFYKEMRPTADTDPEQERRVLRALVHMIERDEKRLGEKL